MSWPLNIHEASVVESEIPTLHQKCNRTYYTNFLNILIVLKLKKKERNKTPRWISMCVYQWWRPWGVYYGDDFITDGSSDVKKWKELVTQGITSYNTAVDSRIRSSLHPCKSTGSKRNLTTAYSGPWSKWGGVGLGFVKETVHALFEVLSFPLEFGF